MLVVEFGCVGVNSEVDEFWWVSVLFKLFMLYSGEGGGRDLMLDWLMIVFCVVMLVVEVVVLVKRLGVCEVNERLFWKCLYLVLECECFMVGVSIGLVFLVMGGNVILEIVEDFDGLFDLVVGFGSLIIGCGWFRVIFLVVWLLMVVFRSGEIELFVLGIFFFVVSCWDIVGCLLVVFVLRIGCFFDVGEVEMILVMFVFVIGDIVFWFFGVCDEIIDGGVLCEFDFVVIEVCELFFLGVIMGCFLFVEDVINFFVGWIFFFVGEGVVVVLWFVFVVVVLFDDGMLVFLVFLLGELWGDRNCVVGWGFVVDGFCDFFKIGWVGGGLEVLDDRFWSLLLLVKFCLCEFVGICVFFDFLLFVEFDCCMSDGMIGGI